MSSLLRPANLFAAPFLLALATLLLPADAHDGHDHSHALLRYANGARIQQVYSQPAAPAEGSPAFTGTAPISWVQAQVERQAPVENGCKLRPRLVAKLCGPSTKGALKSGPIRDKLAIYEFDLIVDQLPIANASRTVVVSDGRPVAIRDRNILTGLRRPHHNFNVSQQSALAVAVRDSQRTLSQLYHVASPAQLVADNTPALAPKMVLWPNPQDRSLQHAWNVTVRSNNRGQPFLRRYWISARSPAQILDFEDQIYFDAPLRPFAGRSILNSPGPLFNLPGMSGNRATAVPAQQQTAQSAYTAQFAGPVNGSVTGMIWDSSPYRGVSNRPMHGVHVQVARHGGQPQVVTTDRTGRYQCAAVQGLATVRCTLSGHACTIINEQSQDSHALYSARAGVGEVNVAFAAHTHDEFKLAQTSAYFHVTHAYDFVRDFMPDRPTKLPGLKTHVNINDSCNAYYDRSETTLNFFRASPKCPNTAYRDVIFHEYGHAVDDELGGVLDGAYSEGFGDALALLMTHSPIVATDFYGPGKHLRDSSRIVYWPAARNGEIHEAGQVYSGFCYELVNSLQTVYSPDRAYEVARQLILGAAVQNPKDIPDAVRLSFFVDAQMFPAGTQSTHYHHLMRAARSRQIPVPEDPRFLTSALRY